jgi:hypothetical protein
MEEVGVEWEQLRRLALRIELRADVAMHRTYNNKDAVTNYRYKGTQMYRNWAD